ncbi:MAG: polyphosphate kinase 1 [bacterium]
MPPDRSHGSTLRYEVRSAEQLDALAAAPLPLGIAASAPRRSRHRDIYLDTADASLRARGVTVRLRIDSADRHQLSLRIDAAGTEPALHLDAATRAADVQGALAEDTSVARRISALVDPALLAPQLDLEVERITRTALRGLLRGPRVELHYDRLTARRDGVGRTFHQLCIHLRRGSSTTLHRLARALEQAHALPSPAADPRGHAEVLLRWKRTGSSRSPIADSDQRPTTVASGSAGHLINPELSLLAFQRRVLAIAEDPHTPLRERLRFLGIVSANVDELYMVRMPELRRAADDVHDDAVGEDGLTPRDRLALAEADVASLLEAQSRCARQCLAAAAALGSHIVRWDELQPAEQELLATRCRDEIHPGLTPLAMTLSPGHPLPHLPHLGLSLAVVFRREPGGSPHLAEFELPADIPRLLRVPGREHDVIAIEELLRANVDQLHPNVHVEGAHLFRVTRGGALALDEDGAESLLAAVATATALRPFNEAVRVEVEATMPAFVAELVLESLRRDALALGVEPAVDDVQVVDGLLDLRCLADLPLPARPELEYPVLQARVPVPANASMFDLVRAGDLLVHHPFDSFDATVVRFLREAAADATVTTIKITLYRVGHPSPVVEALLAATRAGKRVVAFVELKARFDEQHNVAWARALEAAGGNVVYGLVGLKTHAKVALVVRREGERLQRYVHVGTGNYNTRSGRQYTDLSLFSARDGLCADVADLFNELTGSSRAPQGLTHGALVAPHQLLREILALIAREQAHARAGRPSGISIKVNGLSDTEVVHALTSASEAGVPVHLVVRGICTLRPGTVPGDISVVSVVGRFLEHSRIYRFENGGVPEFFMGSSDLRPRNLRRRVELLVSIESAAHRAQLGRVLAAYLDDVTGWDLRSDGTYRRGAIAGVGAQEMFAAEAAAADTNGAPIA